ncbi:MAG: cation diffusion facilitator family transporter, partial [Verrucomicrobiota bacterium]
AEPIAAVIGSLALMLAAAGLTYQSIQALHSRHHTPAAWTLLLLIVVVAVKEVLFRKVAAAGHKAQSTAMKADAWHHRSDAITSVSAFVGISIALIGGKGFEQADNWAALFACAIIGINGFLLFIPAINEIMDAAPPLEVIEEVREVATAVEGVVDIDQCRVRKMGLEFYVDLHVGVDGSISVIEGHRISHRVKDAVQDSNPSITDVLVHIEPVVGNVRGRATFLASKQTDSFS